MYSKTYGMTLFGIDAHIVGVETDVGGGLPCFEMIQKSERPRKGLRFQ